MKNDSAKKRRGGNWLTGKLTILPETRTKSAIYDLHKFSANI
jgi:hypothetical protein